MTDLIRIRRMLPGFVLLAALVSSSLACTSFNFLVATPTPTSTPTATRTLTPTLTPTVTITPTRTVTPTVSYLDWPVVFSDSFDDKSGRWYIGTESNAFGSFDCSITGGEYSIRVTAKQSFFWRWPADLGKVKDFFVTVEMQKVSGAVTTDFGLIFRSGTDFYYFAINPDTQNYFILAFQDDEWYPLTSMKKSSRIDPEGVNRLAVLAQGSTLTEFINGKEVEMFEDDISGKGEVGIALELGKAGDKLNLTVDNFEVTAPE